MIKVKIKVPIWKTRSVGIATHLLEEGRDIHVEILYCNKSGNRSFPGIYTMSCEKALTFPKQTVRFGVVLHIIPIVEFNHREKEKA